MKGGVCACGCGELATKTWVHGHNRRKPRGAKCSVEDCLRPVASRELCRSHYKRWTRYGDPTAGGVYLRPSTASFEEAFHWFFPDDPRGPGCSEWPVASRTAFGHGRFVFHGKLVRAHVASYRIYVGDVPDGLLVLHDPAQCNNPPCVNPEHLRLGTQRENVEDMVISGTRARGERIPQSKLIATDVIEIRELWARGGLTQQQIAEQFGVAASTISRLVNRGSWAHV